MTRREWKTIVLTAIERSGHPFSLWAVGEGPASTGRWFANLTDTQTGGHVHLSSVTDLGPDGMVDDLVTQLMNPERTKGLTPRWYRQCDALTVGSPSSESEKNG